MERLKKLLNNPPPLPLPLPLPLLLAPDDAPDEPNADAPIFLAPEIKSICLYIINANNYED